MRMPLMKRLPISGCQCWLGGLLLFGLCSPSFAADEWEQVAESKQYAIFMSAQRIKPVRSFGYESKPVKVEAWAKSVIISDLVKDGRTIGDYNKDLYQYDCANETMKLITTTGYKKNGESLETYTSPSYTEPGRVVPDSIGEALFKIACVVLEKINKGENVTGLTPPVPQAAPTEQALTEAEKAFALGIQYLAGTEDYPADDEKAAYWVKQAAEQELELAQTLLGWMYTEGKGVPQDDEQAVYWYRKAANQGNATAQWRLGTAFQFGKGTFQDYQKAAMWFRKSAEQGNPTAQTLLGSAYLTGRGVTQDDQQAVYWYKKSAEQNDGLGQMSLGLAYEHGRGVAQSNQQAIKWYQKAAMSEDSSVQETSRKLLNGLRDKEKNSTPKQKSKQGETKVIEAPPAPATKTRKLVRPNQQL